MRVEGLAVGIAWDPVDNATRYNVHVSEPGRPGFLAAVDAGEDQAYTVVDSPEYRWHPEDPTFDQPVDIAIVAVGEQDGGVTVYSDPYMPPEFAPVPLAFVPVAAPVGGRLLGS